MIPKALFCTIFSHLGFEIPFLLISFFQFHPRSTFKGEIEDYEADASIFIDLLSSNAVIR